LLRLPEKKCRALDIYRKMLKIMYESHPWQAEGGVNKIKVFPLSRKG
jgi:hypothetical protein